MAYENPPGGLKLRGAAGRATGSVGMGRSASTKETVSSEMDALQTALHAWSTQERCEVPENLKELIVQAQAAGVDLSQEKVRTGARTGYVGGNKTVPSWILAQGRFLRRKQSGNGAFERWGLAAEALAQTVSLSQLWVCGVGWESVLSVPLAGVKLWLTQAQQDPALWVDPSGQLPVSGVIELGSTGVWSAQERLALLDALHAAAAPAYQEGCANPFVRVLSTAMSVGGSLDELVGQWLVAHGLSPTTCNAKGESALDVARDFWEISLSGMRIEKAQEKQKERAERQHAIIDRVCVETSPWDGPRGRAEALKRMGLVDPQVAAQASDQEQDRNQNQTPSVQRTVGEESGAVGVAAQGVGGSESGPQARSSADATKKARRL